MLATNDSKIRKPKLKEELGFVNCNSNKSNINFKSQWNLWIIFV